MNQLAVIKQQDIDPDTIQVDTSSFRKRDAARAVLLDQNDQVYLMYVAVHGYHKLPGGGIDEGESVEQALARGS